MPDVPHRIPEPTVGAGPCRLGHGDITDLVEDRRMQNVVSLRSDRPRPPRPLWIPRDGARILFFTGVRYCRDEDDAPAAAPSRAVPRQLASERMFDAAAH